MKRFIAGFVILMSVLQARVWHSERIMVNTDRRYRIRDRIPGSMSYSNHTLYNGDEFQFTYLIFVDDKDPFLLPFCAYYDEDSIKSDLFYSGWYPYLGDRGRIHSVYCYGLWTGLYPRLYYRVFSRGKLLRTDTVDMRDDSTTEFTTSSIALDRYGEPHIIYVEFTYNTDTSYICLRHAYYRYGMWRNEVMDSLCSFVVGEYGEYEGFYEHIIIDFDDDNEMYVVAEWNSSWVVEENIPVLFYKRGGVWHKEIFPSGSVNWWEFWTWESSPIVTMKIDREGRPVMSVMNYLSDEEGYGLLLYRFDLGTGEWEVDTLEKNLTRVGDYGAWIDIDKEGVIHILYKNVRYGWLDEEGWHSEDINRDEDGGVEGVYKIGLGNLVIDEEGRPHFLAKFVSDSGYAMGYDYDSLCHVWADYGGMEGKKRRDIRKDITITEQGRDYIEFQVFYNGYADIRIYDIQGRRVGDIYSGYVDGKKSIIYDWSNLSKGVYFIRAEMEDGVITEKVVKVR